MYQYCPKCKRLIEETETCPYCKTVIAEYTASPPHKLTRKEMAMYALGYLILAFVAFFQRDLSNTQELLEGTIIFGAFVAFSVLWFYFRARGGIGYPIN